MREPKPFPVDATALQLYLRRPFRPRPGPRRGWGKEREQARRLPQQKEQKEKKGAEENLLLTWAEKARREDEGHPGQGSSGKALPDCVSE